MGRNGERRATIEGASVNGAAMSNHLLLKGFSLIIKCSPG